jgi:hypothetical protein
VVVGNDDLVRIARVARLAHGGQRLLGRRKATLRIPQLQMC